MEEARAEAETGGYALAIADEDTDFLQCVVVELVALDISQKRAIIPGMEPPEVRGEALDQRAGVCESVAVRLIREKRDALLFEQRRLRRQFAGFLIGSGELTRLVLARLDVRLVEWIDANDRSRDGGA